MQSFCEITMYNKIKKRIKIKEMQKREMKSEENEKRGNSKPEAK